MRSQGTRHAREPRFQPGEAHSRVQAPGLSSSRTDQITRAQNLCLSRLLAPCPKALIRVMPLRRSGFRSDFRWRQAGRCHSWCSIQQIAWELHTFS